MENSELRNLISHWLDGAIEPDEHARLENELKRSKAARDVYQECLAIHAQLVNRSSAEECLNEIAGVETGLPNIDNPLISRKRISWKSMGLFVVAASLLSIIGLWQVIGNLVTGHPGNGKLAQSLQVPDDASVSVVVTPSTEDTQWYIEGAENSMTTSVESGDVLRVINGKLGLKYANGNEVVLHSPTAFQILSDKKSRLFIGRLTATVTDQGKGFSVVTPQATVVDVGTQFGLTVSNEGTTDVVVFQGEVDIDFHQTRPEMTNPHRLAIGEAMRLNAEGTMSRIVSIDGHSYSDQGVVELFPSALITEVQDNIARSSDMMNYYQIVHGGMKEDALAFVDRVAHQWNGIDKNGMPPYLVGADYVKTFNSDKFNRILKINLTVSAPCKLYVLFDDRLPIPAWLRDDFRDTGDNLGMDVGPFQTDKTPSGRHWHNKGGAGVGPGESIDDTHSIWVREIRKPQVVSLGPSAGSEDAPNMYGIAASPLQAR